MSTMSPSAASVAVRPTVAICAGKDCRTRCEFVKMRKALDVECNVVELKCVGICNGPVVVTAPGSKSPAVFARVRSKQERRDVVRLVVDDVGPRGDLRKRAVSKSKAESTIRRVRRVIPRTV